MTSTVAPPATDPRLAAFSNPAGPEVFGSFVQPNSVWKPDPLDVDALHAPARDAFVRLFHRAAGTPRPDAGKIQLLLGAAGSGKTHLLRAFRNWTHDHGGYCGYLQMISRSGDYTQYVLRYLIDALNHPYRDGLEPTPGLTRLACGVLDAVVQAGMITAAEAEAFRGEHVDSAEAVKQVNRLAEFAMQDERFSPRDMDLLRVLLFLLPHDRRLHGPVEKWLRCDPLTPHDALLLGGLTSPPADAALGVIAGLARVMAAVQTAPLVLLVDQLEETYDATVEEKETGRRFRHAVDTLVNVAAHVPTAVVVVASLNQYYEASKTSLTTPKLQRLERETPPVKLTDARTAGEIRAMFARRLEVLFDALDVQPDPANPLFPYSEADIAKFAGMNARDALYEAYRHHSACIVAGEYVPLVPTGEIKKPKPLPDGALGKLWNDFRPAHPVPSLDQSAAAKLLAWALGSLTAELPQGLQIGATADDWYVETEVQFPNLGVDRRLVAVCNEAIPGNKLLKQVQAVAKRAGDFPAVLVRTGGFTAGPKTVVSLEIHKHILPKGKGWKVSVDGDWRTLDAFRAFHAAHKANPGFAAWQAAARPLSDVPAVQNILRLKDILAKLPKEAAPLPPAPPPPPVGVAKPTLVPVAVVPPLPVSDAGPLHLGRTRGAVPMDVTLTPIDVIHHMAFLGASGSGKTTAALALVEQLLLRGIPAVMIDRKGDLARYADPAAWGGNDEFAAERTKLRAAIDVNVFTPGNEAGRSLGLSVAPAGLGQLTTAERGEFAGYAAAALYGMMGRRASANEPGLAILMKALEVLPSDPARPPTVQDLKQLIADRDETLMAAADGYDDRHYNKLAEGLNTLGHTRARLFAGPEMLDIDALLGRGPHAVPGRTRLSVVSTQFLGDDASVEFWVAQMLIAVGRWKSKNPSTQLQAVFLFDEADKYLPAVGKPATKPPMEHLLKQARSAGIGLFLCTQSPGDLDYRCRDQIRGWLVGRITQPTAQEKVRPLFETAKYDVLAKLAGQKTGEFYLARAGDVSNVAVRRSLIQTEQLPDGRVLALARASATSPS